MSRWIRICRHRGREEAIKVHRTKKHAGAGMFFRASPVAMLFPKRCELPVYCFDARTACIAVYLQASQVPAAFAAQQLRQLFQTLAVRFIKAA